MTVMTLGAAAAGAAFGLGWLGLIWGSAQIAVRHRSAAPVLAGFVLRLMLLAGAGLAFVHTGAGAWAAVAALLGFLAVRTLGVARARAVPRQGGR
ncbi:MAG: hypothetical protein RQ752_10150 [Thermohalobaculum sp.]|nr:hypothetical protein [Thermohalobaculum sp.]